jgi:[acyl-carrier-protein] S-malonyltransferase
LMKKAGELSPGSMAAIIKLEDEVVAKICEDVIAESDGAILQLANYNSPGQVVISGHSAAVDRAIELAEKAKAKKVSKLPISIASHSELMRVITDEFRDVINNTPLNLPEMPIVANINAGPLDSLEAIREEMERQLTSSVRWTDSVRWMIAQGITEFVEIGPKKVLTGLIRRIDSGVNTHNIRDPEDIEAFVK